MPLTVTQEVEIVRTPRVMQVEGIFDLRPEKVSRRTWEVDLDLPSDWHVGAIVGPSGAGKSTVARAVFGDRVVERWPWPQDRSVIDGFPEDLSVKEIAALLSSVGFSTPPAWLRPFHALSNGEQFRVTLARTLAELRDLAVVDEFTSVVDRDVARIGSAAVAKTVRRRGQRFVAVSCHYDILDWLEPDWVYEPHVGRLHRGRLRRRPPIVLEVRRVHHRAWELFRHHHYLDTRLNRSAVCFVAFWEDKPVAFSSWLAFMHRYKPRTMREHRTVTLPDYQGVGIGNAVSDHIAAMWRAFGYHAISTTSHPAMIAARNRSPAWRLTRKPSFTESTKGAFGKDINLRTTRASARLTAGFEYVGPPLPLADAVALYGGYPSGSVTQPPSTRQGVRSAGRLAGSTASSVRKTAKRQSRRSRQ